MYTERGVGMERMIDAGGRVTIPKTVRTQLDIKDKYQKGDKVELINMESAAYLIPRGMKGTVTEVDDLGSVHVKWENGMEVAVLNIPGDAIEKVTR